MNYSNPTLLVISGPNGAGKSTHIQAMLPENFEGILSFDRDLTRSEFEVLLAGQGVRIDLIYQKATQLMEQELVKQMKIAIQQKNHFVLETPLSHPDYWNYLDLFEENGYQIQLNYLCLDKISDCVARVGQRVLEGGHYVAPNTIKGVYQKNLEHINTYHPMFKYLVLYDGMKIPTRLAVLENNEVVMADKLALKKRWIKDGLPSVAKKLRAFFDDPKKSGKHNVFK
ncbi:putative ABC-type ATPase [Rhabdobacter roseus]|uniref:Putative ABC-type ATPase n=1 Tax=Rhabdobacter roseus TaxID=1655419 RepID=A0A840TSQ6_9BACT|nr:zeta toxin family protein [Rhabdobacter roseus]MBB5284602.1 putative ABC-type ATPase [Rhabdobacter roseus]